MMECIKCCYHVPQRYILALMGFLAIINAYTMRACLSLAITEMQCHKEDTLCTEDHPIDNNGALKYAWDENTVGWILGAFYIGYIVTHVPGALLCNRFGGKYILVLGIFVTAVLTIITPVTVDVLGPWGLFVVRILMGAGEGTTFPALCSLIAAWVPESERGSLGSFVFGGGQVGTIFAFFASGFLLDGLPWHNVFYIFGGAAAIWCVIFMLICYSTPEEHPFIGEKEKQYLRTELGHVKRGENLPPTPWKAIFTSWPVWALITAQVGHDWGFYIMAIDLPKYMKSVLGVSITKNGLFSALPFAVMWITSIVSGFLCDFLINNNHISVTNARKWLTGISSVVPGIFFMGASYSGDDIVAVVALFTLSMGFMGLWYPGMKVNPNDLSPNYAATIMAISNGIGAITGAASPALVGALVPNETLLEWRVIFWITFVILVISIVVYSIWGSGEKQWWNDSIDEGMTIGFNKQKISELDDEGSRLKAKV